MSADWKVGDYAEKRRGYAFASIVRSVFENGDGDTRLVCESLVIPGMLHIFSPEQMIRVPDPQLNYPVDEYYCACGGAGSGCHDS